jgi:hypothetical protein
MKKTIRLTESDLKRIVKRIIKEDGEVEEGQSGISITVQDIFREVTDILNDFGGYDESMREEAMDLSKDIMDRLQRFDLLGILANYITENYEESIYDILGDGAY